MFQEAHSQSFSLNAQCSSETGSGSSDIRFNRMQSYCPFFCLYSTYVQQWLLLPRCTASIDFSMFYTWMEVIGCQHTLPFCKFSYFPYATAHKFIADDLYVTVLRMYDIPWACIVCTVWFFFQLITYVTLLSSKLQITLGDCLTRLDCFKIAVTNDFDDMLVCSLDLGN